MEKLDRLGWAAGIAFSSHGVRFGIRTNDPQVIGRLDAFLPPDRKPLSSPVVEELYSLRVAPSDPGTRLRQMNLAYSGVARLERGPDLLLVLEALETDLLLRVSERSSPIFVDAGAVEWQGGALLILGEPGSGRTTLLQALLAAGAGYLSDRCAILGCTGRVHPYPTRITPPSDRSDGPRERISVPVGQVARRSVPVTGILLTEYREGARWRPRLQTAGQALLALMQHAMPARLRPAATLATLRPIAQHATMLRGARGEAAEAAAQVLQRFRTTGPHVRRS